MRRARRLEAAPVVERRLEQRRGADDIGLDEGRRRVDRAVDMALGGEVIDRTRPVLLERRGHRRAIADIGAQEDMGLVAGHWREILEIAGVGQLVDGDDALAVTDERANQGRADEAGAAGDDDRHDRAALHTAQTKSRSPPVRSGTVTLSSGSVLSRTCMEVLLAELLARRKHPMALTKNLAQ